MSNRDDLEAIGISGNHRSNNTNNLKSNSVANIIKVISIIIGLIGLIFGFSSIDKSDLAIPIIIGSVVSAVFVYAQGEVIQLLEDIKNK